MKKRLESGVRIHHGNQIVAAHVNGSILRLTLRGNDGSDHVIEVDHVIAATGYRPTVDALPFLSEPLRSAIRTHAGLP